MLGQCYSTSKLTSATVAVEPTFDHRLGFVWRMLAGCILTESHRTKSHNMKNEQNLTA